MIDPLLSPELFSVPSSATSRGPLHAGAVWSGTQRSGRNTYSVRVTLDSVDFAQSTVSGLLEIKGLTPQLSTLTTFFEGEIVGDRFGFLTGRWGATEQDDKKHWARFQPFRTVKDNLVKPGLTFNNQNRPFLFMRWKEQFVVPNHQVQNIHGASFAGFYFICLEFDPPDPSSVSFERPTSVPPTRPALSPFTRPLSSPSPDRARVRLPASRTLSGNLRPPSEEDGEAESETPRQARSVSPPLVPVAPRPRRASSSAFSYAAAVRGGSAAPVSMSAMAAALQSELNNGVATPSSEGTQTPTPKEDHDHASRELVLPPSPASSTSSLPAADSEPLLIPIPLGRSPDEFPAPSSPPLNASPRLGSSSGSRAGSWSGRMSRRNSMGGEEEKSIRTRPGSNSRRASDTGLCGGAERGRGGMLDFKDRKENYGHASWSRASMTGFYFFRHSEPYQELSLHYVPSTNCGATQSFDFR